MAKLSLDDRLNQIEDKISDKSYRTENTRLGYYESQYKAVEEVEDLFGEGRSKPWLRRKKSKSQPCMSVCQGTMNRPGNQTPSRTRKNTSKNMPVRKG